MGVEKRHVTRGGKNFFIMYSRKVQVKYRYEAPREEPREAHGY
jgi:hypothetical protein